MKTVLFVMPAYTPTTPGTGQLKYDAFISYSHTDCKDIAAPVQRALQNIGKPWYKELLVNLRIYRDQTDLSVAPDLWAAIEAALRRSGHFILLASPQAAKSMWIEKEVNTWIAGNTLAGKGLQRMYIVLCDGDIAWDHARNDFDWEKTNCVPRALEKKFSGEPLWIDLKAFIEHKDNQSLIRYRDFGFSEQVAKVIGAIINKPPVEIVSKELQRVKRLRNIYTLAIIVLLLLTAAAVYFWTAQHKANAILLIKNDSLSIQKTRSDSLRIEAERQLKNFKIEEFKRNMRNGKIFLDAEEYTLAGAAFDSAHATARKYPDVTDIADDTASLHTYLDICQTHLP